jgi:hypothetical protein
MDINPAQAAREADPPMLDVNPVHRYLILGTTQAPQAMQRDLQVLQRLVAIRIRPEQVG